jgi:hypothetical protein
LDNQEIIAEGHKFRERLLMAIEHGDVEEVNLYTLRIALFFIDSVGLLGFPGFRLFSSLINNKAIYK